MDQLKILSPLCLEINFIFIIVAAGVVVISFLKSQQFRLLFAQIPWRLWIVLGALLTAGLILVVFAVPREHRIYYDEDIYQNIAQNIAFTKAEGLNYGETCSETFGGFWKRFVGRAGMCNEGKNEYGEYSCQRLEYNKEPNGWAYILSVVYRLFGVHEVLSFLTNNAIFLMSVITVFFLSYLLFNDYYAAIYAALILTLTPEFLIWSNTVAVEPSAAFFPALALLCHLLFIRTGALSALFLAVSVTGFAVQFRPESVMICIVISLLYVLLGRKELKKSRFYPVASILFILLIPLAAHLFAVKNMGWGSSGPKFSLDFFEGNFKVNALFYIRNTRFPAVFTILFFAGLFLKSRIKGSYLLKEKSVLLAWFLLFWGIFVFFYAGSYNYGADVRFSLLSAIPFAMIAGCGASLVASYINSRSKNKSLIHYTLTSIMIILFLSFLPFVRAITHEAWAARADHKYAKKMSEMLPQNSIVLTHNPNMFLVWGNNAAQASLVTEQSRHFSRFFYKYKGGVYFHYNFWCNVNDRLQNSFCNNILNRFKCIPVISFKERNYEYVLYRVERKKGGK